MRTAIASVALVAGLAMLAAPPAVRGQAGARPAAKAAAPAPAAPRPATPAGEKSRQPVTVDADRMERFGKESLVVFSGNVVARQDGAVHHAERMEVYLDEKGDRILRMVSTGNVRIVTRDCKTGTARRAEYFDLEQRMVLMGGARVWQDDNVISGDTITIFMAQDRSVVEGGKQERVKAVFYQQKDRDDREPQPRTASGGPATCAN